jgi:hypothetical protein
MKALLALATICAVACSSTQRKAIAPKTIGVSIGDSDYTGPGGGEFEGDESAIYAEWDAWGLLGFQPEPLEVRVVQELRRCEIPHEAPTQPAPDPEPDSGEGAGAFADEWEDAADDHQGTDLTNPATWGPKEWGVAVGSLILAILSGEFVRRKRKAR